MNEFVTDLEQPVDHLDPRLTGEAGMVGRLLNDLACAMRIGKASTQDIGRRVGEEARAAHHAMHEHPYFAAFVGFASGVGVGLLTACLIGKRSR